MRRSGRFGRSVMRSVIANISCNTICPNELWVLTAQCVIALLAIRLSVQWSSYWLYDCLRKLLLACRREDDAALCPPFHSGRDVYWCMSATSGMPSLSILIALSWKAIRTSPLDFPCCRPPPPPPLSGAVIYHATPWTSGSAYLEICHSVVPIHFVVCM